MIVVAVEETADATESNAGVCDGSEELGKGREWRAQQIEESERREDRRCVQSAAQKGACRLSAAGVEAARSSWVEH